MRVLLIGLFFSVAAIGNSQNYAVLFIPDSLTQHSNAVKRFEEYRITVKSINKVIIHHRWAITILNEAGSAYSGYANSYGTYVDLSDITGTLYDAFGKKIRTVKKKDISDISHSDGFSLMLDDRIKRHNFYCAQYPYTVEYEDEQELNGFLAFPTWSPVRDFNFAVQHSVYTIETPLDYNLKYKQFNYDSKPEIEKKKVAVYKWEVKNLKAISGEIFTPEPNEIIPRVYAAPTEFYYGGYKGSLNSWLEYGKFQVQLNKGRDELPETIKQEVHKLTGNIADPKEKIEILYRYLQSNTRYISIQLGIGGLQPFEAKFVATKRYGDCKALSNYMVALLKEAGIVGYYSIIRAGKNEKFYIPDFPSDQTNHIIVCVPVNKDTIWLECTSQTVAPGYVGSFTDDRYAFVIKEDGGYLVKTPKYTAKDNLQVRKIKATVDESGKLIAEVTTTYSGLQQDEIHMNINAKSKSELNKELQSEYDIPTYTIKDFSYNEHKNIIPSIDENITLISENYATATGKRFFIAPNLLSKTESKLPTSENRKLNINYRYSFIDTDTVDIDVPEDLMVEAMPKDVSLSNQFGKYEIHFQVNDNKILLTRRYERNEGTFPAKDYPEMVRFYDEMFKADRSKIVFVKKES
jgi:hypothetical protein